MNIPRLGLRWLLICGAWALIAGTVYYLHQKHPEGAIPLADFAASEAQPQPPATGTAWSEVALPHEWRTSGARTTDGWYRIDLPLAQTPDTPQALLLWQVGLNASARLNGERIGGDSDLDAQPIPRRMFQPLYFEIPPRLLHAGHNQVLLRVRSEPAGSGFLGYVYVGAAETLRPQFEARYFLKLTFLQLLLIMLATVSLPTAVLWLTRPQDSVYFWHAFCAWSSLAYTLNIIWGHVPVPAIVWDWLRQLALGALVIGLALLVQRFLGMQRPRLERALWITYAAGAAVLALLAAVAPEWFYRFATRIWDSAVVSLGVYPAVIFLRAYWNKPGQSAFWLMVSGSCLLLLGLHDLLMVNRLWPPWDGLYLSYGMPLPLLAFTGILMERFVGSLSETETLNRELADRVRQKQTEIEQTYAALRQAESDRVVAVERERILFDMHDGVGGRLVSMLARLDNAGSGSSEAAQSLRDALNDLRLMIYSMEPSADDFAAALALMRQYLRRQADGAGIGLVWGVEHLMDSSPSTGLNRQDTLQVMRIIQESFTNAVKHARARTFTVVVEQDQTGSLCIALSDDGVGMAAGAGAMPGQRGLVHMRRRAERMGGTLVIEAAGPGTRLVLRVPAKTAAANR